MTKLQNEVSRKGAKKIERRKDSIKTGVG